MSRTIKKNPKFEPIAVAVDLGGEKLTGHIMMLNTTGVLVELDRIPFKVGSYVTVGFTLDGAQITERVRSIKHYDRFFRQPSKRRAADEPEPIPKKLAELHFQKLLEKNRVAIMKHSIMYKRVRRV